MDSPASRVEQSESSITLSFTVSLRTWHRDADPQSIADVLGERQKTPGERVTFGGHRPEVLAESADLQLDIAFDIYPLTQPHSERGFTELRFDKQHEART